MTVQLVEREGIQIDAEIARGRAWRRQYTSADRAADGTITPRNLTGWNGTAKFVFGAVSIAPTVTCNSSGHVIIAATAAQTATIPADARTGVGEVDLTPPGGEAALYARWTFTVIEDL